MANSQLKTALTAVDWNSHVVEFLNDESLTNKIHQCNLRLAVWSKQFENADKGNPALSFIREMQIAAQYTTVLISLALYKPAAAAIRTVFETALYYTYFRTHPTELATLIRDEDFYVPKKFIIEYHQTHSPKFDTFQNCFGLLGQINNWYPTVSAVIHGQIPGAWVAHRSISEIRYVPANARTVTQNFEDAEKLVYELFLCTVGVALWDSFSTAAKRSLLHGLPGATKAILGLDSA